MRMALKPYRELTLRISLIFCGLFVALLLAEGTLRVGLHASPGYGPKTPDGVRQGARHKILILGDSFVDKDGWGQLLYQLLLKDLEPFRVEVLNTAGGGMGPYEYLDQTQAQIHRFLPDTVLLFYYVGNDLTNVQYKLVPRNPLKRFLRPLLHKSYLYRFYTQRMERLSVRQVSNTVVEKNRIAPEAAEWAKEGKINPWFLVMSANRKNYILDNVLMETEENRKAWETAKSLLAQIDQVSREAKARLIILIFPHTAQVDGSHFDFFRKFNFNLDERTLVSDQPQRLLRAFCRQRKIPCLDLLPYFRAKRSDDLYLEKDDHLGMKGSHLSEKIIFRFIKSRLR